MTSSYARIRLNLLKSAFYLVLSFVACVASGEEVSSEMSPPAESATRSNLGNFGLLYVGQWAFYIASQHEEIKSYGSIENWAENPFSPHYDYDNFDYNLVKHTFAGQYYYLYYRSIGYAEDKAFVWSFLSSLAFEFTIETVTERPSFQDLYQTPVFGTVLGIGVDRLSLHLLKSESVWVRGAGYVLNPFRFITGNAKVSLAPHGPKRDWIAKVAYEF